MRSWRLYSFSWTKKKAAILVVTINMLNGGKLNLIFIPMIPFVSSNQLDRFSHEQKLSIRKRVIMIQSCTYLDMEPARRRLGEGEDSRMVEGPGN